MMLRTFQRTLRASRPLLTPTVRRFPVRYYSAVPKESQQGVEELKHEEAPVVSKFTEDYPDLLTGAFGTKDKPVVVKSVFNERIVGCLGATKDTEHILLWHTVKADKPTMCLECGQTFVLEVIADEHHDAHHGDGHSEHHNADGHATHVLSPEHKAKAH